MKKIAVFTSARSEYGLLKPLVLKLMEEKSFSVSLLVGGGHLSHEQGFTIQEIIDDGLEIKAQFPFLINDPSTAAVSRSNGLFQLQISEHFLNNPYDLLIVLGDRSELIPIVSSALLQSIPIAHLSGGEITEGSTDNQVRHAVTKMSHIHFPATEIYMENILKMGEESWRVCVAGEPGLDIIPTLHIPSKEDFCTTYKLDSSKPILLATFHSETINNSIDETFITNLIEKLISETNYQLLFTASNTDIGGIEINKTIENLASKYPRITSVRSLGKINYYAALNYADLVLGNSSSGLIEAQSFNIPVINVGTRLDGRLQNQNVLNAQTDINQIIEAIKFVKTESFKEKYYNQENIFGDGTACEKILAYLQKADWENLLFKKSTF